MLCACFALVGPVSNLYSYLYVYLYLYFYLYLYLHLCYLPVRQLFNPWHWGQFVFVAGPPTKLKVSPSQAFKDANLHLCPNFRWTPICHLILSQNNLMIFDKARSPVAHLALTSSRF